MSINVMLVSEHERVYCVHNRSWEYDMCTQPPHYCMQTY